VILLARRLESWPIPLTVAPTKCLLRAKAGVGIYVFAAQLPREAVDGEPSPAMTICGRKAQL
jgi:hypothetical protein